jgi:ParB family transcriptional regulator, chromosome partitioning protein
MTLELLSTITSLPISEITVGTDRLRGASEAEVAALVDLIHEFGQTTPILVRRKKSGFVLVDGLHRLEATRRAGLGDIPVRAYTMTDEEAQMLEASQNLIGGLSPLDDAVFLAAWKRAHLKKHPETARGISGALAKHGLQANSSSFAEIVAAKRAVSVRQVQKVIAAGERLNAANIAGLRQCARAMTFKDVETIAKIGEAEERDAVIFRFSFGNAKSIGEARKSLAIERGGIQPTVKDPVETDFLALSALWARAHKTAKRRFVEQYESELSRLKNEANDVKVINGRLGLPEDAPDGTKILEAHNARLSGVAHE